MPHTPLPPSWARQTEAVPGRQWAASADEPESLTRTSTPYSAGRGFGGCGPGCYLHDHGQQPADDTAELANRVIRRLKFAGVADVPPMLR